MAISHTPWPRDDASLRLSRKPSWVGEYADPVRGILEKFGGRVLACGGKFRIFEGPNKFHRIVVIEFPSFEKAVACQ